MAEFQYMDVRHPYQYQHHPVPPANYSQQIPSNQYYYPQYPPSNATFYHAGPSPSLAAPPAGHAVAPMPAPPARPISRHVGQPQNVSPSHSVPAETPSPESHPAFTFGWDFTQPDELDSDQQLGYTPSPPNISPGKRQKLNDASQTRRSSVPDRSHGGRAPASRPAVATQHPLAQYAGMPRTPLTDHAFGVIMQTMEGNQEPAELQPLSELHRRLFPPNCHISYLQDSRM